MHIYTEWLLGKLREHGYVLDGVMLLLHVWASNGGGIQCCTVHTVTTEYSVHSDGNPCILSIVEGRRSGTFNAWQTYITYPVDEQPLTRILFLSPHVLRALYSILRLFQSCSMAVRTTVCTRSKEWGDKTDVTLRPSLVDSGIRFPVHGDCWNLKCRTVTESTQPWSDLFLFFFFHMEYYTYIIRSMYVQ